MKKGVNARVEVERRLRGWLRDHYSVICFSEATQLGASAKLIEYKADCGAWTRLYRGVFRDSAGPPGPRQDLRAAWLATAKRGVVSHRSAAWLWGLVPAPPQRPELTVARASTLGRDQAGFKVHRSRDLHVSRVVGLDGLLVTNPMRTLVDMAVTALPDELTEATDVALKKQLFVMAGLEAELARLARPGRDGVAILRRHLVARGFTGAPPPSVLESHARRLVVRTGLRDAAVELRAGEDRHYRLDIAWAAIRFAVEVDGYVWHFSPEHMQGDLDRRNHLQQAGWTLLVFTWRDLVTESERVERQIIDTHRRLTAASLSKS